MFDNITSGLIWLFVFLLCFGRKTFPILLIGGVIIAVVVWGTPKMWVGMGITAVSIVGIVTSAPQWGGKARETHTDRDYEVGTITSGGAPDEVAQGDDGVWSRI